MLLRSTPRRSTPVCLPNLLSPLDDQGLSLSLTLPSIVPASCSPRLDGSITPLTNFRGSLLASAVHQGSGKRRERRPVRSSRGSSGISGASKWLRRRLGGNRPNTLTSPHPVYPPSQLPPSTCITRYHSIKRLITVQHSCHCVAPTSTRRFKRALAWTSVHHLDLTLSTRFPPIQTTSSGIFLSAIVAPEVQPGLFYSRLLIIPGMVKPFLMDLCPLDGNGILDNPGCVLRANAQSIPQPVLPSFVSLSMGLYF